MSSQDFFRNSCIQETTFFDEGPIIHHVKPNPVDGSYVNTSSINTSNLDPFRQGVELTQLKHFDAGLVKIHAGEPGHVVRRNSFGMNQNFRASEIFQELDYFNPITYLQIQGDPGVGESSSISLTFPILTSDNDQSENYIYDGAIEPFPIREVVSFFSLEAPFQARGIKGSLMAVNEDQHRSCDDVLTIYEFDHTQNIIAFLDMVDMFEGRVPMNGYFIYDKAIILPFVDAKYSRNCQTSTTYTSDMIVALSAQGMTGSTDNYVSFKHRAAVAGWDYVNSYSGTDSIAFGGLEH